MGRNLTIVIDLERRTKSHRDHFLGFLRAAREHEDWTVEIGREPSDFTVSVASGGRRRTMVAVDPVETAAPASVEIDDGAVAEAAARTLLAHGFAHAAYVGSVHPRAVEHDRTRQRVFESTAGGRFAGAYRPPAGSSDGSPGDLAALRRFLAGLPTPCAIMAYNDARARDVLRAAKAAGIAVPDLMAVIGVDDDDLCEAVKPTLSSVRPDFERAGYEAGQLLAQMLANPRRKRPLRTRYGVRDIVERLSTRDPKGGGRIVSAACDYIRRNFTRPLPVGEIAAAVGVSRRLLELRFVEVTGANVRDFVSDLRLGRAQDLLRGTARTVKEIALDCGFSDTQTLRLLFRRRLGYSPLQVRQAVKPRT